MPQPKDILKNVNLNKLFPPNSPFFFTGGRDDFGSNKNSKFYCQIFFVLLSVFLRDIPKFSRSFAYIYV